MGVFAEWKPRRLNLLAMVFLVNSTEVTKATYEFEVRHSLSLHPFDEMKT